MNWQIKILRSAEADVDRTAGWYNKHQPGIGDKFIASVAKALRKLSENPLAYPVRIRREKFRWCFTHKFPYKIVYQIRNHQVFVVAVAHLARRDRAWKTRL